MISDSKKFCQKNFEYVNKGVYGVNAKHLLLSLLLKNWGWNTPSNNIQLKKSKILLFILKK